MIEKLIKITKIAILVGLVIYSIYDIIALNKGGSRVTLSNVILRWIWGIPFISYAIAVLFGHFYSLVKVSYKKNSVLPLLIMVSVFMLIVSIMFVIAKVTINPAISLVVGFLVGTFFWPQRSKD
jgi:hypothetical protein